MAGRPVTVTTCAQVLVSALLLALVGAGWAATPAAAATTTAYGQWEPLTGSSNDYESTLRLSPRFPAATVRSDSRSGQVGVQSGASTWLPAWTPVGQRYGSSQGEPYVNLRPRTDSATGASETTYTFERPTPGGWAFVLGDIDADAAAVSAVGVDGQDLTTAQLGFRGTFNVCAQTPRPSSCPGQRTDLPSWDPDTATLNGNPTAVDTTGATGWFEPTVPVRSLTIDFTRRAGFPVYQTWFALRMQDVTGTVAVSAGACDVEGISVDLLGVLGNTIATTTTDASGAWSFTGLAASSGYRVALGDLPTSCRVVGPTSRAFDLSTGDAEVPFAVREVVPAAVEGTVTDQDGAAVGGVTVLVTPSGGGAPQTTTTDQDGRWIVDGNVPGDYTVSAQAPPGYSRTTPDVPVTVPAGDESPIEGVDFALAEDPTVSGTVRAGSEGVPGAVVELQDGAGTVVAATVTGADGTYAFPQVPLGLYAVVVTEAPGGYRLPPSRSADVRGGDAPDTDFLLSRDGAVGGLVSFAGAPQAGVSVVLTGPGGTTRTLVTDGDGRYFLEGLAPGTWTVTLRPPPGTTATTTVRVVEITAAGETFGAEDFLLQAAPPTTPPPTTSPTTPPSTTVPPTSTTSTSTTSTTPAPAGQSPLANTGSPVGALGGTAVALLLLGAALRLLARSSPARRH